MPKKNWIIDKIVSVGVHMIEAFLVTTVSVVILNGYIPALIKLVRGAK